MNPRVRAACCRARLAGEDVVLEVGAAPKPRRHLARHVLGGAHKRPHPLVDRRELRRVQIRRASRHEYLTGESERAPDRLARLRLRLARDAARVDYVQLRLVLGSLDVPRGEQRPPGDHRVSLRDLAAEELDGERRHGGRTLARPPLASMRQLSRTPAAGGFSCSSCAASCRGVLEPARGARRKDSCANPARGLGRGTTTSRSRPPSVTPIASGLGNWLHLLCEVSFVSRIATSRSRMRQSAPPTWARWTRSGGRGLSTVARTVSAGALSMR